MTDFDMNFPPLGDPGPRTSSAGKESKEADEEWEMLSTEEDLLVDEGENDVVPASSSSGGVIVEGNPNIVHHCNSSPDLRCFDIFEEDDDQFDEGEEQKVEDASSFAILSTPGSVISWASSGRSFRDALNSSPAAVAMAGAAGSQQERSSTAAPASAPRPFRKAKIVVAATTPTTTALIRRCSQSSPNLLGLIHEDHEVMGDTDAMDFYHRKAKGAQGRASGLKLRPDEAKRKQYSVNKRNLQRQGSLK